MSAHILAQETGINELCVMLTGELDHHASEQLREKLDEMISRKNYRRVVFDMGGVSFMDSSGIGILLGRYKKLSQSGCAMEIKGAREGIDKIIKMAGLYQITRKR